MGLDHHFEYQAWYSQALKAVQQLAPDRYDEFRKFYETDPKRKSLVSSNYVIQDYLKFRVIGGKDKDELYEGRHAAVAIHNQLAILASLSTRIDSVLANIEAHLLASFQDAELSTARDLVKTSPRAAGALAGVVLEDHLQKVANARGIKIAKKSPTIGDLNNPLKDAVAYDIPTWRKISCLADIRNLCSHKKSVEPKAEQVIELIDGVNWVIKNVS